ncbi:hypothetical protein C8R44DRAFT_775028 [Mycena epipterygia]|nr:hypothetical protein C8R44DRAFT_775028 [Mycena epipterygia]
MPTMYRWMVFLTFLFPMGTLAAFIVDGFTKPALTCEPLLIQWQGGKAPWTLRVLQSSDSALLENLGTLKVTSLTWNVDLAAGTSVLIQLQDSTGATATSKVLTVQAGSTDCTLKQATTSTSAQASAQALTSTSTRAIVTTSSTTPVTQTSSTLATVAKASSAVSLSLSPSSVVVPPTSSSTTSALTSENTVTDATGSTSQSQSTAYSTESPQAQALSATTQPVRIGAIVGTVVPGVFLLLLFCAFLFRRRRRRASSTAGVEELAYGDDAATPAWFNRPAYHPSLAITESTQISYGVDSAGSYRNSAFTNEGSETVVTASSASTISRAASFVPPDFSPSESGDSQSTVRWSSPSSASGDLGQRMQAFRFPMDPVGPPPST